MISSKLGKIFSINVFEAIQKMKLAMSPFNIQVQTLIELLYNMNQFEGQF